MLLLISVVVKFKSYLFIYHLKLNLTLIKFVWRQVYEIKNFAFSFLNNFFSEYFLLWQVKKVIVYLGRDKTMQLLEELVSELQLTDPVSSGVTHMDNPPYYRITSSYKIPSVTSGEKLFKTDCLRKEALPNCLF